MTEGCGEKPWYLADEKDMHRVLFDTVASIITDQASYRSEVRYFQDLYYNFQTTATRGYYYAEGGNLKFNLAQACTDTAASLVLANKPVPFWQATDGTWREQRSARKCSQMITGQFHNLQIHKLLRRSVPDGLMGGLGALYGYLDAENIPRVDVLHPLQVVIDHDESLWDTPRTFQIRRPIAREVVKATFKDRVTPEVYALIDKADPPSQEDIEDFGMRRSSLKADMVMVREGYHLASVPGWDDGVQAICLSNCTLYRGKWEHQGPPLALYKGWSWRRGYVGQGIIERVRGDQERINEHLSHINALYRRGSNTIVFSDRVTGPKPEEFTNIALQVLQCDMDKPPVVVTTNAVPPELLLEVDRLTQAAMYREGLNATAVSGEKPAGVDSGKALLAADDMGQRRQVSPITMVEDFAMDTARLIVRLNDLASKRRDGGHQVAARVRRGHSVFSTKFNWSELKIDPDNPSISLFPMSSVATTPAGRYAQYEEMTAKGWLDMSFAMELYQMPDVDAFASLQTSDQDLCQSDLERILDGERRTPDPFQNLKQCAKLCLQYYFKAKESEADEDVLQNLLRYLQACQRMLGAAAGSVQPTLQPGAPGGALPQGGAPGGTLALPAPQMAQLPASVPAMP